MHPNVMQREAVAPGPTSDAATEAILEDPLAERSLIDPLHEARGLGTDGVAQRLAGGTPDGAVSIPTSGGSPLPGEVRSKMEASMGADFSSVRVHEGDTAGKLGAVAFTQGNNIHAGPGGLSTHTIAHELAHVVQQRQGRVPTTGSVGGVPLNDDAGLEAEADRMADAAIRS